MSHARHHQRWCTGGTSRFGVLPATLTRSCLRCLSDATSGHLWDASRVKDDIWYAILTRPVERLGDALHTLRQLPVFSFRSTLPLIFQFCIFCVAATRWGRQNIVHGCVFMIVCVCVCSARFGSPTVHSLLFAVCFWCGLLCLYPSLFLSHRRGQQLTLIGARGEIGGDLSATRPTFCLDSTKIICPAWHL